MRRRRTRKQWYQYHLEKAQREEKGRVESIYGGELRAVKDAQQQAWKAYTEAREREPLRSRLQSFLGIDSTYRMDVLYPLKSDAAVAARALSDAVARHRMRLEEAEKRGAAYYHEAREARKLEAEARVQRVAYK